MSFRNTLSCFWANVQSVLFPSLEMTFGELSSDYKKLIAILEMVRIEELVQFNYWNYGRPCKDRHFIARSFVAKVVLKITYNKQLINLLKSDKQLRMICGWNAWSKIPSESKFSRAFKEFAEYSLPEKVHTALIKDVYKNQIVGHVVKDSTPLIAREKSLKKKGNPKERKLLKDRERQRKKKEWRTKFTSKAIKRKKFRCYDSRTSKSM